MKKICQKTVFVFLLLMLFNVKIFCVMLPPTEYQQWIKWISTSTILVVSYEEKKITIMNSDGILVNSMEFENPIASISISPDGTKITYYIRNEGFFASRIDGTDKTKISDEKPKSIQWSPDGKKFIFTVAEFSKNPGERKITTYIVNPDGSNKKILMQQIIPEVKQESLTPSTTEQVK